MKKQEDYESEKGLALGCLLELVLLIVGMALFCSCASHKTVTEVTDIVGDTITKVSVSSSDIKVEVKDSTIAKETVTVVEWENTIASDDLDEIITEHIVEVTDMIGNRTTTTDRTTQRKHTTSTDTSKGQSQHTDRQQTTGGELDWQADNDEYGMYVEGHWESHDSLTSNKQLGEVKKPKSTFRKIIDTCLMIFFLTLFVVVVYLTYAYKKRLND